MSLPKMQLSTWQKAIEQSEMTAKDYFRSAEFFLMQREEDYTTADVVALAHVMALDFLATSITSAGERVQEGLNNDWE